MTPIEALSATYPFPSHLPGVPQNDGPDWNQAEKINDLRAIVPHNAAVVMEIGCFLGRSTRGIATLAQNAKVICIDHWQGSPEHMSNPSDSKYLPTLFETFVVNCWGFRDRFLLLRMDSMNGLRRVHEHGVRPEFIYVDGAHDYASVTQDLMTASSLFPGAVIAGDDYQWESVKKAVDDFGRDFNKRILTTPANLFWFKN